MPINVEHQPQFAAISQPAFLSGQGKYNQWFGEFQERAQAKDEARNMQMLQMLNGGDRFAERAALQDRNYQNQLGLMDERHKQQMGLRDKEYEQKLNLQQAASKMRMEMWTIQQGGYIGEDGLPRFPGMPDFDPRNVKNQNRAPGMLPEIQPPANPGQAAPPAAKPGDPKMVF